jgi:putative N6-adenine-specific DNA methylase
MTEFVVPCLFGLEGPAADELRRMGIEDVRAENGHVRFSGGAAECAKANLRLRTGERVLLCLGSFEAKTFDQLFEGTRALPWADYIPKTGAFPVKGYCLDSALHSVPDCQKIVKKAVSKALGERYGLEWLPEGGILYQIQFSLVKDRAELYLDTTGAPLFKRGYRPGHVEAPLRETLAAALVNFARYRGQDAFCDPFCGSGTIPIEAALIARNRAPGLSRDFSAQKWTYFAQNVWRDAAEEARSLEYDGPYHIFASDISPKAVALSRENAARAGVAADITFSVADARQFTPPAPSGVIVANPPYGERMLEKNQAEALYRDFGAVVAALEGWRKFILSSDEDFERMFGKKAQKKRKLYNGMIRCNLYMYFS